MLPLSTISAVDYAVNSGFAYCPWTRGVGPCTSNFAPAWSGDCKQAAALKLQMLIAAGAQPGEFRIENTRVPGGRHAVVVQVATGLVLDIIVPQVEPRALKERHEGMVFEGPCGGCELPAVIAAASLRRGR